MILRPFCVFSPFSLFISCKVLYNWTKAEAFLSVFAVVLLAEDVDRNSSTIFSTSARVVVLLAEDVDRNDYKSAVKVAVDVVLLAEDVDRNVNYFPNFCPSLHRRPPRGGRG